MVGLALAPSPLRKPLWLDSLLVEKFFDTCEIHAACKKNERNIFCIDCSIGICQHCHSKHALHRLLQIRRYVYHDVIRLHDIQKLLDCGRVQTYIINSARVVFLNQRPQPKSSKGLGNSCKSCDRSLQEAYRYCSVACKAKASFKLQLAEYNMPTLVRLRCDIDNEAKCLDRNAEAEAEGNISKDSEVWSYGDHNELLAVPARAAMVESSPYSSPTSSASISNEWDFSSSQRSTFRPKLVTSPRSVIPPASISRRKGKPHRSPIC